MTRPSALAGVTVLDLTRLLPGAFCSQILADFGARVIKIEEPGRGDYNRAFPPIAKEESGSFLLLNRNKESLTLNLKSPEGKAILARLAQDADVIIEGFRPGVMTRLDLDYETLRQSNPGLIYCAITGFGQDGPYARVPGHDLNYMALAGTLGLFGKAGEGPIVPGLSIADVGGGSLTAAIGILTALISRSSTGKGQFIDISMTDGAFAWLSYHGADYLFGGIEPKGGERQFIGQAPCYNVYRCADGRFITVGCIEPQFWQSFCEAVGLADEIDQWPQGEEAAAQSARISGVMASRNCQEWLDLLLPLDVPVARVNGIAEAIDDPQLCHRQMLLHMEHPVEGTIPQLGFPIKLSETPAALYAPPPLLGQHNEAVLNALGYSSDEVQSLRDKGAI